MNQGSSAQWLASAADVIGYSGAGLIALAYLLNQRGSLSSEDWRFPAVNLLGSWLILVSLYFRFNAPSFAIELFWSAISLYGIWRHIRMRRFAVRPDHLQTGVDEPDQPRTPR